MLGRRELLTAAGAGASLAVTRAALGQEIRHAPSREGPFPRGLPSPEWVRYPEPNVRALDARFNKYMVGNTYIERLWTGAMWAEGPVWFGDVGMLIFSDIPNDRILKYDERSGEVSVLRQPSNYVNGNTRDRDGRLLSCSQEQRAVIRTEHDGKLTVVAAEFEGKKLNGPNDIVVKSDSTIWFTDPGYGLGSYYESNHQTGEETPRAVYRLDPRAGTVEVVSKDQTRPNGLAFSPDEKKLYICDTGITDGPDKPSDITAYDVGDDGKLSNRQTLFDLKAAGSADGADGTQPAAEPGGVGRQHAAGRHQERGQRRHQPLRSGARAGGGLLQIRHCRRHPRRRRRQHLGRHRLGRAGHRRRDHHRAGRRADRPHLHARSRRQRRLRRCQAQPAVHGRQHVALRGLCERRGRRRGLMRGERRARMTELSQPGAAAAAPFLWRRNGATPTGGRPPQQSPSGAGAMPEQDRLAQPHPERAPEGRAVEGRDDSAYNWQSR
jgi:gluconolactonase